MSMGLGVVLAVEDDPAVRRGLVDALRFGGYRVIERADGESGLEAALTVALDLVLLDVLLPGRLDGFQVLGEIRRLRPTLPVILVTAKGAEDDRVQGLHGGADDYVVKPFSARELLARVAAVLRRSPGRSEEVKGIQLAGCRVDLTRGELLVDGRPAVPLSEREAALLRYLAANPGRVISREELLLHVWRINPRGLRTRTVDMHVVRLREKLGDDPERPRVIQTVRAKGYVLAAPVVLEKA